jgi:hypothetical protein
MSKSSQKALRGTHSGRWTIIDECRVPEGFTTIPRQHKNKKTGVAYTTKAKPVSVNPAFTKAVLLALAKWDSGKPDKQGKARQNFTGLESICHSTQLGVRSVKYAIAVLKEAGILRKSWRGFQETCLSHLDWDKIQSLRVEFRADSAPALEAPQDATDDAVLASLDEPKAEAEYHVDTQALFGLIFEYPVYRTNLAEKHYTTIGSSLNKLLQKHDLEDITIAWNTLTGDQEWRRTKVITANNPAGFLYKMLDQETVRQKLIREEAEEYVDAS